MRVRRQRQRDRDEVGEGCSLHPGLELFGGLVRYRGPILVPLVALGDRLRVPLLRVRVVVEPY